MIVRISLGLSLSYLFFSGVSTEGARAFFVFDIMLHRLSLSTLFRFLRYLAMFLTSLSF